MTTWARLPRSVLLKSTLTLLAWSTVLVAATPSRLPTVVTAHVPFYPAILQKAHFDGVVHLRVTTDGRRPLTIDQLSGQPMLLKAAVENIRTWEFEQHTPTSFEVSFRYRLLSAKPDSACNWTAAEPASVVLRLPTEVEISAPTVGTCDPFTSDYK
jgi:hypothetical protein